MANLCNLSCRINVERGEPQEKVLATGKHSVRDIFCKVCLSKVGWSYVSENWSVAVTHPDSHALFKAKNNYLVAWFVLIFTLTVMCVRLWLYLGGMWYLLNDFGVLFFCPQDTAYVSTEKYKENKSVIEIAYIVKVTLDDSDIEELSTKTNKNDWASSQWALQGLSFLFPVWHDWLNRQVNLPYACGAPCYSLPRLLYPY